MAITKNDQTELLSRELDKAIEDLGFLSTDKIESEKGELPTSLRRRRRKGGAQDERVVTVTLTKDADGVLRWEDGVVPFSRPGRRMRRGPGAVSSGETVKQLKFEKMRLNEIGQMLASLDQKLTPNLGKLRRVTSLDSNAWETVAQPAAVNANQRILVFIHGTFSSNDHVVGTELTTSEDGKKLLTALVKGAKKPYDEVLAFDHPTLSVSPMLNALDLSRLFANTQAQVDVICHSRGGLVTRWWLEVFERSAKPGNVVLVGSPLGGTSLADPTRLRSGVEFLANIGNALGALGLKFGGGNPFLVLSASLVKVISSFASLTAKTPLVDAAIAMIPGLAAQSRVANNFELSRLRTLHDRLPNYFAVKSNFQPEPVSVWKFWKAFVDQPAMRAANTGVDFIFARDEKDALEIENDLVVNTRSMTDLFGAEDDRARFKDVLDFGTNGSVHHVNYFQQPKTVEFIRKSLGIS